MYLTILILPLLGSFISGFFGRKIGVTGSHIITCSCLILSSILATIAFYEVGLSSSPVIINLFNWIDSENMTISWEFLFDQLTVSMFIPVLYISSLIHIFSTDYMAEDPHNQRFFSYLSLFTFFMLVLVSGANFFVMFVGWEGIVECLKWDNNNTKFIYNVICLNLQNNIKFFSNIKKLTSKERIGPHNIDIISIIIGSTLGHTHLERRKNGIGTRVIFEQSNNNVEYLMWFHNYLSTRGYCSYIKPRLKINIKHKGKVYHQYRINSYTFTSFNWIHEMFYKLVENNIIKIVPLNIEEYLTPLALAIWFMGDGSSLNKGAKIATNCFTFEEVNLLCKVLQNKYNIIATPNKCRKDKGYIIYIHTNSIELFSYIIKPYLLPSLYYKLGIIK
jgi:LAGLIDADG DNA endonuclease family/NADH-Ubiquinone oxidoreductase (complex I), chain 5 N-terminus